MQSSLRRRYSENHQHPASLLTQNIATAQAATLISILWLPTSIVRRRKTRKTIKHKNRFWNTWGLSNAGTRHLSSSWRSKTWDLSPWVSWKNFKSRKAEIQAPSSQRCSLMKIGKWKTTQKTKSKIKIHSRPQSKKLLTTDQHRQWKGKFWRDKFRR